MNTTDYIVNLLLIGIVIRQIRGEVLSTRRLLFSFGLIAGTCAYYLRSFPTAGNDVELVLVLGTVGATLGALCGLTTHLTRRADGVFAKAGFAAAAFWIVGMAGRIAFAQADTHGYSADIVKFSVDNHITSGDAWVAALVTMALASAVMRIVVVRVRASLLAPALHAATENQWAASVA
jgi:hypothetical protein